MATITIKLPDSLAGEQEELKKLIASKLYEIGKLTLSQGAEMCSMGKWDFAEVLASYKVPYFQYDLDEIQADLARVSPKTAQ